MKVLQNKDLTPEQLSTPMYGNIKKKITFMNAHIQTPNQLEKDLGVKKLSLRTYQLCQNYNSAAMNGRVSPQQVGDLRASIFQDYIENN